MASHSPLSELELILSSVKVKRDRKNTINLIMALLPWNPTPNYQLLTHPHDDTVPLLPIITVSVLDCPLVDLTLGDTEWVMMSQDRSVFAVCYP